MFSALKVIISYSSIRVILYVIIIVLFSQFFIRVLAKRKWAVKAVSVALLAAFVLGTAFIPVENAFMRFQTPEASVGYSMPNEKVLKTIENGDWAAVMFDDKKMVWLQRDEKGWKAILPGASEAGVRRGTIGNIVYRVKKLTDDVYCVGVEFKKYADPKNNENKTMIETLTDSLGTGFLTFQREVLRSGEPYYDDIFFYAFVDADGEDYHLVINGEQMLLK